MQHENEMHPNLMAFHDGVKAQQEVGREAAERHQRDLDERTRHSDIVRTAMRNPEALDPNDPDVKRILGTRAAALSSALRGLGRK